MIFQNIIEILLLVDCHDLANLRKSKFYVKPFFSPIGP